MNSHTFSDVTCVIHHVHQGTFCPFLKKNMFEIALASFFCNTRGRCHWRLDWKVVFAGVTTKSVRKSGEELSCPEA